jgi:lipopolysaccharide export system protein LptC
MSEVARSIRSERQRWALPGGRHDRLIATTNWLLPVMIGVLAAFLVMAPLTMGGDSSFVLDKNKVAIAHERMRIRQARYSGLDTKGQPFALTAGSAVQKSSAEPIVRMADLAAAIRLSDGPAVLKAPRGRYDMDNEQVAADGAITLRGPNNYSLDTSNAIVDLKTRKLRSGGPATGTVRQGVFSANRLRADLEARTVTLDGNARLRIDPSGPK